MNTPDVVFLIPGFFGFDRFGSFYYFADRMSADLRGHLEAVLRRSVPVIPLGAGPADPLSFRQTQFLASMRKIVSTLDGVKRIHLFGHSTGGLDAELFLRRQRVDREPWTADDNAIRHRIASVCTIAAPHYGTTLALTDLSRWLSHPVKEMSLAGAGLPAVSAFLATVPQHALSFSQALGGTGALLSFLKKFFQRRELLHDLMPARIEAERAENVLELSAPVSCFVTCPLPNPKPTLERFDIPDSLFLYLTNHTAGARVDRVSAEVMDNIARLNDPSTPVIASISGTARPPHDFDELDNDAVVNTARQLLPGAELAAIVYADHADVLGHYDRRDPAAPDRIINEGVFRSGARFGDDEFFVLYREVAARIAAAALAGASPEVESAPRRGVRITGDAGVFWSGGPSAGSTEPMKGDGDERHV